MPRMSIFAPSALVMRASTLLELDVVEEVLGVVVEGDAARRDRVRDGGVEERALRALRTRRGHGAAARRGTASGAPSGRDALPLRDTGGVRR